MIAKRMGQYRGMKVSETTRENGSGIPKKGGKQTKKKGDGEQRKYMKITWPGRKPNLKRSKIQCGQGGKKERMRRDKEEHREGEGRRE